MDTTLQPRYGILYDKFVETQAQQALRLYNSLLPTCANALQVTDALLLEQLTVAEQILHAFSKAFILENQAGVFLDTLCQNGPTRESADIAHVVGTFNYLNTLLQHPVFEMLTTARGVYERRRPLGALRDIRWIFKPVHNGLRVVGEKMVFQELTAILYDITRPALASTSPITKLALQDFEGYILDEEGNVLINERNFGTAAVLAQSALESAKTR